MAKKNVYSSNDLPSNIDAEKIVLGSALSDANALVNVISSLQEEDFSTYQHKTIFNAILSAYSKNIPVDTVTVLEELQNAKSAEEAGGVDYLKELMDSVVSFASIQYYINIVVDQSVLRKMLLTIREIDENYKTGSIDNVNDFILQSESKFKDSIARRHISSFVNLETATNMIKAKLDILKTKPISDVVGISTGYPKLDELTQGFQKGEVTIVAARPSVGKTALTLNFAYNAAVQSKVPVAIFSLEMPVDTLVTRLIAMDANVSTKSINTGHFTGSDGLKVNHAIKNLNNLPIYIDETPSIKLMDLVAKTRKLQATNPDLGLVVIDYLGLISSSSKSSTPDSRNEEVRKISAGIKAMAKDLKLPVVVVCQLNRLVERRDGNRPMISDLRDSGDIEQDADVIMLLYRPDYYKDSKKINNIGNKKMKDLSNDQKVSLNNQRNEKDIFQNTPEGISVTEVNVAKNRNGATGRRHLWFYKEFSLFQTPDAQWEEQMQQLQKDNGD